MADVTTLRPGDVGHRKGDPAPSWGYVHTASDDGSDFTEWPECDECHGYVKHTDEAHGVLLASDVAFHS